MHKNILQSFENINKFWVRGSGEGPYPPPVAATQVVQVVQCMKASCLVDN